MVEGSTPWWSGCDLWDPGRSPGGWVCQQDHGRDPYHTGRTFSWHLGAFTFISKQNTELRMWQVLLCCLLEQVVLLLLSNHCPYWNVAIFLHIISMIWNGKDCFFFCSTFHIQHREKPLRCSYPADLSRKKKSNWHGSSAAIYLIITKRFCKLKADIYFETGHGLCAFFAFCSKQED